MPRPSSRRLVAVAIPLAFALATAPLAAQQPAADSQAGGHAAGHPSSASPANATTKPRYTQADVEFMQHMIGHHAQALVMTGLVPARTTSESMRQLAQRIEVSQRDEIALMRHWLEARGQAAPNPGSTHEHHEPMDHAAAGMLMPGMLTSAQLAQLEAAQGAEFDRMFLEFMIRHHEGALTMVASLFATPGAGQEAEVFRFASDVDTDQRAEIARMRTLLSAMPKSPHP
jgi:uncharacterized protein (DUF305 family)